jgi:hypothetical protein
MNLKADHVSVSGLLARQNPHRNFRRHEYHGAEAAANPLHKLWVVSRLDLDNPRNG